jgi:hypothetical protein
MELTQEDLQYYNAMNQKIAGSMVTSSPINNYGSTVLMLTDPDREVHRLELSLRGFAINDQGNEQQVSEPLMNDQGVNSIISHVRSIVNQVTIMSDLEENHIYQQIDFLGDTIIKDLLVNHAKYNCKPPVIRDKIHQLVTTTAFICIRRSLQAGERKGIYRSIQEITTKVSQDQARAKGSFFSNVLGWGKK